MVGAGKQTVSKIRAMSGCQRGCEYFSGSSGGRGRGSWIGNWARGILAVAETVVAKCDQMGSHKIIFSSMYQIYF